MYKTFFLNDLLFCPKTDGILSFSIQNIYFSKPKSNSPGKSSSQRCLPWESSLRFRLVFKLENFETPGSKNQIWLRKGPLMMIIFNFVYLCILFSIKLCRIIINLFLSSRQYNFKVA